MDVIAALADLWREWECSGWRRLLLGLRFSSSFRDRYRVDWEMRTPPRRARISHARHAGGSANRRAETGGPPTAPSSATSPASPRSPAPRPRVHHVACRRAALASPVPAVGRPVRSARPRAPRARLRFARRPARQFALAGPTRRMDTLSARAAALGQRGGPDGVVSLAFDANDPVSGLYLRTRRGWSALPRGALVGVAGARPGRPVTAGVGRRGASQRSHASGQRGADSPRSASPHGAVYGRRQKLRQSGLVSRHVGHRHTVSHRRRRDPRPALTFGLPSPVVGALPRAHPTASGRRRNAPSSPKPRSRSSIPISSRSGV